uniref:Hexosyltransferase n=1 Tax=Anas platyrhynchos TaxID=8839 RepID=A0A8B9TFV5_ANAPL
MQLTLCRLRTHQWCFILFNVLLFHMLLFGADLLEEYFLRSLPLSYTDAKTLEIREKARKLDMDPLKANLSKSYTISSAAACSDQEIFLLVLVCSSPENRTRRNVIRQTWGNVTDTRGYAVLTLFALGKPTSVAAQLEIDEESQKHRDIIEGSFIDSPEAQTQKMLMIVEWTVTFCPHARYILKTDEEMFVGIPSLAGYLLSLTQLEDVYTGRVIHQRVPDRAPQSPGSVPIHRYSEEFYPDYCDWESSLSCPRTSFGRCTWLPRRCRFYCPLISLSESALRKLASLPFTALASLGKSTSATIDAAINSFLPLPM